MDSWLCHQAPKSEGRTSRTYVVTCGSQVIAFYTLAAGSLARKGALKNMQRNAPLMLPVMILGRLAVDLTWQGKGLGPDMLRDAILRTSAAAEVAGISALLVHAKNNKAKQFYERFGFKCTEFEPMTLMITLKEAAASLIGAVRPQR